MSELRSNLPRMVVLARVVELGSFSAAARELGLSRPAVSAAIAALEQSLGVTLLHRTTRSSTPTEVGRVFARRCAEVLSLASLAVDDAAAASDVLQGTLRVTAPGGFIGEKLVAPVLGALAREHGVRVELMCSDRRVGLVEGGFDVAVRVGVPREDGLIMRRVGRSTEVLVAAPAVAGTIRELEDLRAAPWVKHAVLPRRFTLHGPGRRQAKVVMGPGALVDDSGAMMGLLRSGAGVGLVPRFTLAQDLEAGTLEEVFPGRHGGRTDIFVLLPSARRVPARVRLLIEGLGQALKV